MFWVLGLALGGSGGLSKSVNPTRRIAEIAEVIIEVIGLTCILQVSPPRSCTVLKSLLVRASITPITYCGICNCRGT